MESPCESDIEHPGYMSHGVKLTENRPLGESRRIWEANIRMEFKEIGVNTRNWIDSAHDTDYWRTLMNAALNLRVSLAM